MKFRIHFTSATVNFLRKRLDRAYQLGEKRLVRRISALLAYSQGQMIEHIAQDFSVTQESLYAWLRAFLLYRFESLGYHTSKGRPPKLTKTQKRRLKEILNRGAIAYGFTRGCWSSLLVQQVILEEFGVLYNPNYVCTLLKNLGYSYQKAKFVSAHIDPKARKKWLKETWGEVLLKAKERNAMILFVDEASFPQWGTLSYTWAPRGEQPEVQTSGKRKAYKIFGAADVVSGQLFYQGIEGRFNSQTYAQFLTWVMQKTKGHLIIIQDGARYHTSKATKAFFQTHHQRLTRYQLPSYSPDFNPIEHLWQAVRDDATHNKYFAQFDEVVNAVEDTLRFLVRHPMQVRQTLGDYATAEDIMPKAA